MGIETSAYMALEIARMRCWERGDGLGAVNRVAATSVGHNREGLEEAGQAGASAGHRHLPGTREQTLESGSKVLAGCISLGKWGGSCTAPLPAAGEGLQMESSWLGLAALGGLIIPLGRRSGGQQQGQLLLQAVTHHPRLPEPPEKFWDVLEESCYCNPLLHQQVSRGGDGSRL